MDTHTSNAPAEQPPRSERVIFHFDKIRCWVPTLKPCKFKPRYRRRLELYQPMPAAIERLTKFPDLWLNGLEVACNLIFSDREIPLLWDQFFKAHHLVPRHRSSMRPKAFEHAYYTRTTPPGARKQRHSFTYYSERPCKITGQPCFHFEGRYPNVQTLRKIGVYSPHDLLDFDLPSYFARHMTTLFTLDPERLDRPPLTGPVGMLVHGRLGR